MHPLLPEVHIEQFEGPYDLLIELAKKEKVKLSEISLCDLTQKFIAYMEQTKIPTEIVASFVLVASTLLLIKARQVLPRLTAEEDEEVSTFEERIALYQQYRDAAEYLGVVWDTQQLLPANFFAEGDYRVTQEKLPMPNISPQLLADAMHACIGRIPPHSQIRAHITPRGRSLADLLKMFQERVAQSTTLVFQETIQDATPQEQAVSFLAVLEMARNQEVTLEQHEVFGTLTLHKL